MLPDPIHSLVSGLSKLPGIGPRSAERIALFLVQTDKDFVHSLANLLIKAKAEIRLCEWCGGLTEKSPCRICSDPRRDAASICLVEKPVDILSLEKSGAFHGLYHVLGGKISPLNGVGPDDLRIAQLENRLKTHPAQELIIALPGDVEGDATSSYLKKLFANAGLKVSRIAQGLPVGGGLDFADDLTLSRALEGRREFT